VVFRAVRHSLCFKERVLAPHEKQFIMLCNSLGYVTQGLILYVIGGKFIKDVTIGGERRKTRGGPTESYISYKILHKDRNQL